MAPMSPATADAAQEPLALPAAPIVVYGASGYTGKLISAELVRRDADLVLAGRNAGKLEQLSADLGGGPRVATVPLEDRAGLAELIGSAAAVIACAGPFTVHGEAVIEAAAENGTPYLDTTGEQPFIRASFERWGRTAARSGATLVSGMGFDYLPGDLLAGLCAAGLGPLERLTIAYSVRGFEPTRGTALSTLEMLRGGDVEWSGGRLRTASRRAGRGSFGFPSPIGSRRVGRYPSGEQITVPRHVETREVRSLIDLESLLPLPLGPLAAPAMTAAGLALSTPLRGLLGGLIAKLPEGPSEQGRKAVRYTLACEAEATDGGRRSGVLRGSDIYGTTAVALAEGALRLATAPPSERGALAPSQAFDPRSFLSALAPVGVSCEIEEEA